MARPITWSDVAYRGNAAAIEVFGRGGDRIAEAFKNIGQIAVDNRNQKIEEATKQAVAGIMNSDNPDAAVAAVPQGWQYDPLAIAKAGNVREDQLQTKRLQEETILTNQAAREMQQAQLQDLRDKRDAEAIIQRNWEASAKAGRVVLSEEDSKMGQASLYAGKELADRLGALRDDQRADKELGIRARESNARMAALDREMKGIEYLGWAREFGATPEAQMMEPEKLDSYLVAEAKKRGLPATYADQAAGSFGKGVAANPAADSDLDARIPGSSKTYRDGLRTLSAIKTDAEAQKAAVLAMPYDESNPDKPDPNRPSLLQLQEIATRGPGFTDGPIGFVAAELAKQAGIDQEEAKDRLSAIKSEYRHLNYAQAADLAFQSKDRWNVFGDWNVTKSPEVKSGALIYREIDRLGGKEGVDRIAASRTAQFDRTLAELPTAARQLSGSARARAALPEKVLEWDNSLSQARAKRAAEEAAAAEAAARAMRMPNPGTTRERF
jgi:hypothetical protein